MPNIGVRELKNQATQILRAVREQQAEYIVTYHGKPIARLLPIDAPARTPATTSHMQAQGASSGDELALLRKRIDQAWSSPVSGVELLEQDRR